MRPIRSISKSNYCHGKYRSSSGEGRWQYMFSFSISRADKKLSYVLSRIDKSTQYKSISRSYNNQK